MNFLFEIPKNVQKFNIAITTSDQLILEGKLKKALKIRCNAIKEYGFPNSRIMLKTLRLADHLRNGKYCKELSLKLAEMGLDTTFGFQTLYIDTNLHVKKMIQQKYNSTKRNDTFRYKLYSLLESDQNERTGQTNYNPDSLRAKDSVLYSQLLNLISKFGYPTEKNIGISRSLSNTGVTYMSLEILLNHWNRWHFHGCEKLIDDLNNSQAIDISVFMELKSAGKFNSYNHSPIFSIHDRIYSINDSLIGLSNIKRKELGARSIEQEIRLYFEANLKPLQNNLNFISYIVFPNGLPDEVPKPFADKFLKLIYTEKPK